MDLQHFDSILNNLKNNLNQMNCVIIEYYNDDDIFEEYPTRYYALYWDNIIEKYKLKKKYMGCGISNSLSSDILQYDNSNIYNFIEENINFKHYQGLPELIVENFNTYLINY